MAGFATPWHTLTVTDAWYCRQDDPDEVALPCRDEDGWCTGHAERADDRYLDPDFDLVHPAECGPEENPNCLTADLLCGGKAEAPVSAGSYRIRALVPDGSVDGAGATLESERTATEAAR
jgi:hypothetical protein